MKGASAVADTDARLALMEERLQAMQRVSSIIHYRLFAETRAQQDGTTSQASIAASTGASKGLWQIDHSFTTKPMPIGALLGDQDHFSLILKRPPPVAPVQ